MLTMYWLILESSALSLICDTSPAACQLEPQLMLDREMNETKHNRFKAAHMIIIITLRLHVHYVEVNFIAIIWDAIKFKAFLLFYSY